MDFEAALELFKSFPACQMRIFKQFSGFPDNGDQTGGYVVFAYASVANEPCYCELRDLCQSTQSEHNALWVVSDAFQVKQVLVSFR